MMRYTAELDNLIKIVEGLNFHVMLENESFYAEVFKLVKSLEENLEGNNLMAEYHKLLRCQQHKEIKLTTEGDDNEHDREGHHESCSDSELDDLDNRILQIQAKLNHQNTSSFTADSNNASYVVNNKKTKQ